MAAPLSPTPEDSRVSISHVVTDPIWSLRCWSVEVLIGRLRGIVPAMSAAEWLTYLMHDVVDLFDIVPGLCGDEFERMVFEQMMDGVITKEDLRRVALDTLSAVTGRPWWFSMRLIKSTQMSWEIIGGELAFRGVDASRLSIAGWLDAVLLICLRNMESAKVTMFMSQLEAPPQEEMANVEDMEMSADTFLALGT